jgi:hypothetical protein
MSVAGNVLSFLLEIGLPIARSAIADEHQFEGKLVKSHIQIQIY